jgi:hypothetical protein
MDYDTHASYDFVEPAAADEAQVSDEPTAV